MSEQRTSKPLRILSLGAGVQSSTVALMMARGEIEPAQHAVFADTQGEPKGVYQWLDWLEKQLPFPVHRVTAGNLRADVVGRKDGYNPIPAYRMESNPLEIGPAEYVVMGRRQCTWQYKLRPLHAKMRELAGLDKGERSDGIAVVCVLGISYDEVHRMKNSPDAWRQHEWPLVDRRMTRGHCLEWLEKHAYPRAPRSACTFCPYKSDKEWKDAKDNDPATWHDAISVDNALREYREFLHRSGKPLHELKFWWANQKDLFGEECEGMCGV